MKFVRLSTVYPDYLKKFYASHPGLEREPFTGQMKALMYDGFAWADSLKVALEPLGYNVEEVVANAEPVQRAWAKERGLSQPGNDWLLHLAARRIEELSPDILFIGDYVCFSRPWIENLRKRCPSIRLVLGWCGAPYLDDKIFRAYDLVLSCCPELVERFEKMGLKARHLMHAFNPDILNRLPVKDVRSPEFTFAGQIVRYKGFHEERERLLLELAARTPLVIFSPSHDSGPVQTVASIARWAIRSAWKTARNIGLSEEFLKHVPILGRGPRYLDRPPLPVNPRLRRHLRPPLYGLEMYRMLMNSIVTLNNHISLAERAASNMRLFEATGVGTCLLTDHKDNISQYFEVDRELVTYRGIDECVEKARYLLNHQEEAKAIGRAGQERTLRDHNFDNRARQLDEIIREAL